MEPAARERLRARLEAFAAPARAAMLDVKTELIEERSSPRFSRGAADSRRTRRPRDARARRVREPRPRLGDREGPADGALPGPDGPARAGAQRSERVPFGTVLCPVDFSASSQAALAAAAGLAATAGAALVAVHVLRELPETEAAGMVHFNVPEYRRLLEKEAAAGCGTSSGANASEAAADARIPLRQALPQDPPPGHEIDGGSA